ncbi:Modifier of rudimentary, Modr, partial [Cynara cardunculus var. scolymus]
GAILRVAPHVSGKRKTAEDLKSCLKSLDNLPFQSQSEDQRPPIECSSSASLTLRGSQEQQADPRPPEVSTNSLYPPSGVTSPSSSRPTTPNSSNSNSFTQRPEEQPQFSSHVPPAEAAAIIVYLKDKSVDELRKLLSDEEVYQQFLHSIDLVKTPNNLRDELRDETLQLASKGKLGKRIVYDGTAEPELMNEMDEESETVHKQLLEKEMDVATFIQKYKKLRVDYHKRALTHLAAKTCLSG